MKLSLTALFVLSFSLLFSQKPMPSQALEISLDNDENIPYHSTAHGRINSLTRYPIALYGINFKVPRGGAEEMAREYLSNHVEQLGLRHADLSDLQLHAVRETNAGKVVRFRQHHMGIPVNKAELTVSISPNDHVVMLMSSYTSQISPINIEPKISAQEAQALALNYIQPVKLMAHDITEKLMIYQNNISGRLAYDVMIIADDPLGEWHVFVDAQNGEIFKVKDEHHYCGGHNGCDNNGCDNGCQDQHIDPPKNQKSKILVTVVNGSGYAFDPDPLSSNLVPYGGNYADNADATNVDLDAARFTVALLQIEEIAGVYKLLGPWAEISDHSAPNKGLFTQGSSVFNFNRNEDGFEAANCYFHVDSMMRYINITLGCNVVPFQYATGVKFDPSGANGADNSFYSGGGGTITFGEGGVDDAEDSDVIHHELGHFLHDMVTVGGLSQNQGLSEGCGDYVAQSYNRSLGNWTVADPAFNWVFNWDGHNPFWGGRITNYAALYPGGLVGQVHTDGQIWASTLMTIWDQLGRDLTDKIFYEGLGMTNGVSNQNDAAAAVLQAAINLNYSDAHQDIVYDLFTARGYTLPPVVHIGQNETSICLDNINMVDFTDDSHSSLPITSRMWTFEGGSPGTSTMANPTITYTAEGVYDVTLMVTDANGSRAKTLSDHITVLAGANCINCVVDLDVPNPITGIYQASNSITSNGTVMAANDVTFKSENTISLLQGFEVALNAIFTCTIESCP